MGGGEAEDCGCGGVAGVGGALQDLSVHLRRLYTMVSRNPESLRSHT